VIAQVPPLLLRLQLQLQAPAVRRDQPALRSQTSALSGNGVAPRMGQLSYGALVLCNSGSALGSVPAANSLRHTATFRHLASAASNRQHGILISPEQQRFLQIQGMQGESFVVDRVMLTVLTLIPPFFCASLHLRGFSSCSTFCARPWAANSPSNQTLIGSH